MFHTISVTNRSGALFFTRIKLVASVLACARAIARIKWRRLKPLPSLSLFEISQLYEDFSTPVWAPLANGSLFGGRVNALDS